MSQVLDIYKTAVELVREYGHEAELEAAKYVKTMHDRQDIVGQGLWRGVLKAVAEIQGQALSKEFQNVLDLPKNGKAPGESAVRAGSGLRVQRATDAKPREMLRSEKTALEQMQTLEQAIKIGVPSNLEGLAAKLRYIVWSSDIGGDEHTERIAREALEGLERIMAREQADALEAKRSVRGASNHDWNGEGRSGNTRGED